MQTLMAAIAGSLPVLGTVGLFLVLYANCLHGRLILAILMLLNLAVAIVPVRPPRWQAAASVARLSALCMISGIGTLLVIELLFPVVLPADYAQIRDLADRSTNAAGKRPVAVSKTFSNEQQVLRHKNHEPSRDKGDAVGWHEPGKVFEYYGYDPNEGFRYVNKIRWNSEGFFDHDHSFEKPGNTYRIVVIGDSYVEALQVPLVATFHKLLEAALNKEARFKSDTAPKFQVIALGNSGAGQEENNEVLKQLAIRFHPDMVMMTLCSNDFCDDDRALHDERDVYLGQVTPVLRGLLRHGYYVLAFAVRRYAEVRRNTIAVHPEFLQWSAQEMPRVEAAWTHTLALVKDSRDYCAARDIAFKLVYLGAELELKYALAPEDTVAALGAMGAPYRAIKWDMDRSVRRVTRFCAANGIPLISLLEPLVKGQKESGQKAFGDHYSFFGHKIAAEALQKALDSDTNFPGRH